MIDELRYIEQEAREQGEADYRAEMLAANTWLQRREYQSDEPDLIVEACLLRNALEEAIGGLVSDCAGMNPTPEEMRHMDRLTRLHAKAERRLERREFKELGPVAQFGALLNLDMYDAFGEE